MDLLTQLSTGRSIAYGESGVDITPVPGPMRQYAGNVMPSTEGQDEKKIGMTPNGNKVTLEMDSRVEGPGPTSSFTTKAETGTG